MLKPNKRKNKAVSEVLGTLLLLVISVSLFSVIYISFFAVDLGSTSPSVNMVGSIQDNNLIIEHKGGKDLDLKTEILMRFENGNQELFTANDKLDSTSKNDGKWNIGENIEYNLNDHAQFTRYETIDLMVIDRDSNSVIINSMVKEERESDLEIILEVDDNNPSYDQLITYTLTINNNGPSETDNVKVSDLLPQGIEFQSYNQPTGQTTTYDKNTGNWDVGYIDSGDSKRLFIEAYVRTITSDVKTTRLIILIDGSDSITQSSFNMVLNGIGEAIQKGDIPHNGKIKLTIIQFGTSPTGVELNRVEIDQILDNSNYQTIANSVTSISKIGGYSLLPGAILFTASYTRFTTTEKVILFDIITDGKSNFIDYAPPADDDLRIRSYEDNLDARDLFVSYLNMNEDEDEINCIVLNGVFGEEASLLRQFVVWPPPGYGTTWPPREPGWASIATNAEQINQKIAYQFDINTDKRTNKAEILESQYSDPDSENNIDSVTIYPTT